MAELSPEARARVMERDDYTCQVCGWRKELEDLHVHHVQFRSLGGDHDIDNLVVVCWRCHTKIHAGTLRVGRYETDGEWHTFWEHIHVDT